MRAFLVGLLFLFAVGSQAQSGSDISLQLRCDGHDETAALQNALNSYQTVHVKSCNAYFAQQIQITRPGVTLEFGVGTYTFGFNGPDIHTSTGNSPILIRSDNVTIEGKGQQTVLELSGIPQRNGIMNLPQACESYAGCRTRQMSISIHSLKIDGRAALSGPHPRTDSSGNGILIGINCERCSIHDTEVSNFVFHGICYYGGADGTAGGLITNNSVHNFGEVGIGLEGRTYQTMVSDNHVFDGQTVPEIPGGPIGIFIASLTDITGQVNNDQNQIVKNRISSVPSAGIEVNDGAENLLIAENVIDHSQTCVAVLFSKDSPNRIARNIHITGNSCSAALGNVAGAIRVSGSNSSLMTGLVIEHNTIQSPNGAGIFVTRASGPVIRFNTITGPGTGGGPRKEGIFLGSSASATLQNNVVSNAAGNGITVFDSSSTGTAIQNNTFQNNNGCNIKDGGTSTRMDSNVGGLRPVNASNDRSPGTCLK